MELLPRADSSDSKVDKVFGGQLLKVTQTSYYQQVSSLDVVVAKDFFVLSKLDQFQISGNVIFAPALGIEILLLNFFTSTVLPPVEREEVAGFL